MNLRESFAMFEYQIKPLFCSRVLSRWVMCEGAKQQMAVMTYKRELWEFPVSFWDVGWSWLNGSIIYLFHSLQ